MWWEWFGSLFLAPYLWFKGKEIEKKTEKAINTAGYIGVVIIIVFLFVLFKKAK